MSDSQWSRRRLLGAIGTVAAGAAAGCSFGGAETTPTQGTPTGTEQSPGTVTGGSTSTDPGQTNPADSTYTQIYREVVSSVVAVRVETLGGTATGTAWVYDDNYVVTNEHVVGEAESISVWFEGEGWRRASRVGMDVYSDLAVLQVRDRPDDATPLPLVANDPPVGTRVMAIGNPFGLSGSLTTGVISGKNRTLPAPNGFSIPDAIQTDAAVNPGNSGGPLVSLDGDVVGVINSGGGDNVGFAISAPLVGRVVPALIERGNYEHPYMGIGLKEVTPEIVEANDLPISRGVYVSEILRRGPSEDVLRGTQGTTYLDGESVEVGGDVIVGMGDREILTQQSLSTFLALETTPGDTIDVEIIREGQRMTVQLTVGSRPDP